MKKQKMITIKEAISINDKFILNEGDKVKITEKEVAPRKRVRRVEAGK